MKKILSITFIISIFWACNPSNHNSESQNDWIILFDGGSTDALRGYGMQTFPIGIWQVENGTLIANPDTTNRDLITKDRFRNFEMEYEWAVDTGGNSGVFFHMQEDLSMESGNGNSPNWLDNFEIQVLDDQNFHKDRKVKPKRSAGAVYDLIAPENKKLKPVGDFNKARLIHHEGHVEHWLNGNKVVAFEIDSPEMKKLLADSKFKDNPGFHSDREGHVMFQHHGQKVYYRNIRIRKL